MATIPRILGRYPNRVDLSLRNDPNILEYKIIANKTLSGASGGTVELFRVLRDRHYRSPSLVRKKLAMIDGSKRGLTMISFDINDFASSDINIPADDEPIYLQVQGYYIASGAFGTTSPIIYIPTSDVFNSIGKSLSISDSAPGITATIGSPPPAGSLAMTFPVGSQSLEILNLDAINALLVSYGANQPMLSIPAMGTVRAYPVDEIYLASANAAAVGFSISASSYGAYM